ncbi:MAG: prepilin-type N-terminal cleavage/methylation domain-containing protein [Sedimentisphaerales bacterium]|nr:prepilin-type N-terminal cleavage/methylation domain-containing protein [Sedimentisphaerales bacterium]
MNDKRRTTSAFTLMELMVAVAILGIVLSFAGVIFNASINTHRVAAANSEIMQKLRAITGQLDADFEGLRKDGEIFAAWVAVDRRTAFPDYNDCDGDGFERLDRIMFFTSGDFQSYGTAPMVRGNLARVCYMLASRPATILGDPVLRASEQPRHDRVLARTQHIITADPTIAAFNYSVFTDANWFEWNNVCEYEKTTLEAWKHIPLFFKQDMLTEISDVNVFTPGPVPHSNVRGAQVDPTDSRAIHMLLCEGVGEFKVQGWYDDQARWVPEVDPDSNDVYTDSDFFWSTPLLLDRDNVPHVLYPYRRPEGYGHISLNGVLGGYRADRVNEVNFNSIPGLGRALKFTFTLFDSKGIIKEGRTFTHIVYLDR